MWCSNCGSELENGALFCSNCGRPADEPQSENNENHPPENPGEAVDGITPQMKNRIPKLLLGKINFLRKSIKLSILAASVVLVVAVILVSTTLFSGRITSAKNSYSAWSDDDTCYLIDKSNVIQKFSGEYIEIIRFGLSEEKQLILRSDEEPDGATYGEIIVVNGNTVEGQIEDAVVNKEGIVPSADGSAFLYFCDFDAAGLSGDLMLYRDGKTQALARDVWLNGMVISPDGHSVMYMKADTNERFETYLSVNGAEAEKLEGNRVIPIAISNGGQYIYYMKFDATTDKLALYVRTGNDDERLASEINDNLDNIQITLNQDASEMLFCVEEVTYLSVKGGEKQKICNVDAYPVRPNNMGITGNRSLEGLLNITMYGFDTFRNCFLQSEDALFFINADLEGEKIVSNSGGASISRNGKVLMYLKKGVLFRTTADSNAEKNTKEIGGRDDIQTFQMSADGSAAYFLTAENELRYVRGNDEESTKVADDVYQYAVHADTNDCYFIVDYAAQAGTLRYSKNGRKSEKVSGGMDAQILFPTLFNTYVKANSYQGDDYYLIGDILRLQGEEGEKLLSDARGGW